MNCSLLDDAQLVSLLNDEAAFSEIYRRYRSVLYEAAKYKVDSSALAEEIVQDIFADLWERRNTVEIIHLRSYLYGALRFQVSNHIRGKHLRQSYEESFSSENSKCEEHTANSVAYYDLAQAIENVVKQLPEKTRKIFVLNYFEHYSTKEISTLLSIPKRTIEYHLTQSSRLLRTHLREFVVPF